MISCCQKTGQMGGGGENLQYASTKALGSWAAYSSQVGAFAEHSASLAHVAPAH